MNKFSQSRAKYKPKIINYLLTAEAPPMESSGRFFYYENMSKGDSLFLEIMKVLYFGDNPNLSYIRQNKNKILKQFQKDGFYLEDSVEFPIEGTSRQKIKQIKEQLPHLKNKINKLAKENTKIILISATVFKACYEELIKEGLKIINRESIAFPGSGGQKRFKKTFSALLKEHGFNIKLTH